MSKCETKQDRYRTKMHDLGFINTVVLIHPEDKPAIQKLAIKLRKQRGYEGQPKRAAC